MAAASSINGIPVANLMAPPKEIVKIVDEGRDAVKKGLEAAVAARAAAGAFFGVRDKYKYDPELIKQAERASHEAWEAADNATNHSFAAMQACHNLSYSELSFRMGLASNPPTSQLTGSDLEKIAQKTRCAVLGAIKGAQLAGAAAGRALMATHNIK